MRVRRKKQEPNSSKIQPQSIKPPAAKVEDEPAKDLQTPSERSLQPGLSFADISLFPKQPSSPTIQPKLIMGKQEDKCEQEADTVAEQVVDNINNPQTPVSGQNNPVGSNLAAYPIQLKPSKDNVIQRSPDTVWGMSEDAISNLETKPKQALKILKNDFYSNWFVAKDYLVENKWQGKSKATVREKQPRFESLMRTLLRIRKLDTNLLLMHIRDVEFAKDDSLKNLQPAKRLTWSAAGSETLTSDIDVNLKGEGSVKAVGLFNKLFKTKYGWPYDPGTVYDVNVYAQDFMTPDADRRQAGGHVKVGKPFNLQEQGNTGTLTPVEETNEIMGANDLSIDAFNLNQDVWSLVKVRMHMTANEWTEYKLSILGNDLDDHAASQNPEAFARREQMKDQILDAEHYFQDYQTNLNREVQNIETSADNVYVKMRQNLQQGDRYVSDHRQEDTKKMMAANILYEQKLNTVEEHRNELKQLRAAHPRQDAQIKKRALKLKNALSEAIVYANEAYLSQGGVQFVVLGYQIGGGIEAHKQKDNPNYQLDVNISREAHLQSMREQVGDTLKVFGEHETDEAWKAAYKAGKYIDRLIKSAEPLIQEVNLNQDLQTDFNTVARIGQTAVRLKAKGKNSKEQKQALKRDNLVGDWTVANLREVIIAIGTEVEKAFRPQ